jgi:tetratricopeptide (TPR) repeat protein
LTSSLPSSDRNVIPRWRDPVATLREGEIGPVSPPTQAYLPDLESLRSLEQDWQEQRSTSFAADLVGSALVVGPSPVAREAAAFVLTKEAEASSLVKAIAARLLEESDESDPEALVPRGVGELRDQVQILREQLRRDPRLVLSWTELARHYASIGSKKRAARAMQAALGLSPESRYVIRAAVRLRIHQDEYREAHDLVLSSAAAARDPWLAATELSAAAVAGRRPHLGKVAREMLERGAFLPRAVSELASALGTLELRAGNDRAARRLFTESLTAPNENAIAQGEWASRQLRGLDIPPEQREISAEALALNFSRAGKWSESLRASWEWHRDQPFSSRPTILGSYEASVGRAFQEGVEIARRGLRANPETFLLQNNLVFCQIGNGELAEAKANFDHIHRDKLDEKEELPTYLATAGLLAFRTGSQEEGRELYEQAIRRMRDKKSRMIAQIMLTRELLLQHLPDATELLQEVLRRSSQATDPDLELWIAHLPDGDDPSP